MTNKQFKRFVSEFRKKQDQLIQSKGHDYTMADADRLFNFKFVAKLVGITPQQVVAVYWLKHILAILTYVKFSKVESEGIESRFLDEANYNLLMKAVVHDNRRTHKIKRQDKKKKMSKMSHPGGLGFRK